jgi:hypothetical protein
MTWDETPPPIELHHKDFRAVAQNFFTLPVTIVADLKIAREYKTGDEIIILLDAAEIAFTDHDYENLQDLTVQDFVSVMNMWVTKSGESAQ